MNDTKEFIENVIETLKLVPLDIEGGMVRESYVSDVKLNDDPAGTAIYYLLTDRSFSHLHRLSADEIYHFYLGEPVELLLLYPDGSFEITILGSDILNGELVQKLVPAGTWQGSRLKPGGKFALMGTTMTPGYTPECYEHGDAEVLKEQYQEVSEMIERLTGEIHSY